MRLLRRMKAEAALLIALADIGGVWPVMRVTAALTDACRYRGRRRGASSACRCGAPRPADSPQIPRGRKRQRLHRAGDGQDGRARAQLFERHRPHRVLRRRGGRAAAGYRAGAVLRAPDARAGQAAAGAHRRRLRLSHRPAAAPRSGLDPDRDLDRRGARLLRERRPELGARGDDQGAPLRRRHRGRREASRRTLALHLAQISRLRRGRRHPRHEAADPRLSRPRRDRGRGPQHQARPRRHSRDRVLRADPAAHRRRPPSRAARARDAGHAGGARRRRLDRAPKRATSSTAAYRFLRTVEHRLQMVADEQTHTLPGDRAGLERFARFLGFADRDAFAEALLAASAQRAAPLRRRCSRRAASAEAKEQALRLSRGRRRSRDARQARRHGLSQAARSLRAGARLAWPAAIVRCKSAVRRARSLPNSCRCCCRSLRAPEIRTRRCIAFDRFLAGLHGGGAAVLAAAAESRSGRADRAGAGHRAAARRHPRAVSRGDGCGDRSELLRRAAGGRRACREPRPLAAAGRRLRGLPRPHPHVRPGAHVPDRHAHPVRHRVGRAGGRGLRAARRRAGPLAARAPSRTISPPARPHARARRSRSWRSASSAAAR